MEQPPPELQYAVQNPLPPPTPVCLQPTPQATSEPSHNVGHGDYHGGHSQGYAQHSSYHHQQTSLPSTTVSGYQYPSTPSTFSLGSNTGYTSSGHGTVPSTYSGSYGYPTNLPPFISAFGTPPTSQGSAFASLVSSPSVTAPINIAAPAPVDRSQVTHKPLGCFLEHFGIEGGVLVPTALEQFRAKECPGANASSQDVMMYLAACFTLTHQGRREAYAQTKYVGLLQFAQREIAATAVPPLIPLSPKSELRESRKALYAAPLVRAEASDALKLPIDSVYDKNRYLRKMIPSFRGCVMNPVQILQGEDPLNKEYASLYRQHLTTYLTKPTRCGKNGANIALSYWSYCVIRDPVMFRTLEIGGTGGWMRAEIERLDEERKGTLEDPKIPESYTQLVTNGDVKTLHALKETMRLVHQRIQRAVVRTHASEYFDLKSNGVVLNNVVFTAYDLIQHKELQFQSLLVEKNELAELNNKLLHEKGELETKLRKLEEQLEPLVIQLSSFSTRYYKLQAKKRLLDTPEQEDMQSDDIVSSPGVTPEPTPGTSASAKLLAQHTRKP
ncbi:unnamed protein product [Orchesella dallaii]|uniref:Uncharacterized protein n=1 Tax=Orchesella dallaii TaxID=48710 RepID=A0ABP1QXF8_9HEXA